MIEFDDIQHILLTRVPALSGRYEFLSFRDPKQGRAWVDGIRPKVLSAAAATTSLNSDKRWVSVALTWSGLRALGIDDASLASFPDEFRQGMVARARMLGDIGANDPAHWVGDLANPDLHAVAILFARDAGERERVTREHQDFLAALPGVQRLSGLDLDAFPPLDYAHDHFGYRDRFSQPEIEGSGTAPTPGSGAALKPGRVHSRLPRRKRSAGGIAAARYFGAKWHLHGLSPATGACRRFSRLPPRAGRPDQRRSGS